MRPHREGPSPLLMRFLLWVLPPGVEGQSMLGDLVEEFELCRKTLGDEEAGRRLRGEARELATHWI